MVRGEHCWRGIHAPMLVEERANILGKLPVVGLPGGVQCSGGLFIGASYLLPTRRAAGDERGQTILAPRDSDGLFVGAAICGRDLATTFAA